MPQFILDVGSVEGAKAFNALDSFTQGYITAMLWTEEEELEGGSVAEIAPESLVDIVADCLSFQTCNAANLEAYQEAGHDLEHAGHDFWLTRNGHGVGFWDRGMGDLGEHLSKAAKVYGEVYVCLGDDGLVHHD